MAKLTYSLLSISILFSLLWSTTFAANEHKTSFYCSLGLDGRAMAEGEFVLSENRSTLRYKLVVHNVKDITMAHLHLGQARKIGTPVAWVYPAGPPPKPIPGMFDGVLAEGTITGEDLMGPLKGLPLSSLINQIQAGNVYLNIHTKAHPRGGICGPVYLIGE